MTPAPCSRRRALVAGYEPDLPIVRGVDIEVARGEFVAHARAERRRQVHARQGDRRPGPGPFAGRVPLDGADITAAPAHEMVAPRPRLCAADRERLRDADDRTRICSLAADILPQRRRAGGSRRCYALFPDLAERPARRAGAAFGRRAADAGDRARADRRAALLDPRRAFGRAGAEDRRRGVRAAAGDQRAAASPSSWSSRTCARRSPSPIAPMSLPKGDRATTGRAADLAGDPLIAELYLGARRARHGGMPEPAVRLSTACWSAP